jgi:CheY-like chemotaxis protein
MDQQKRVLIIDDDHDFAQAVASLFTSSGYATLTAENGRDGLELARKTRPDLIVLDVMMTERTEGIFTLHQIRSVPALHDTPVIVASSIYTDQPGFKVSPEAGWLPASLFLPKPLDPARLLQEAARLIADSPAHRSPAMSVEGRP